MTDSAPALVRRTQHAVIEVPIAERSGAAIPLLLLGDGPTAEPSVFAAAYLRNLQLEGFDVVTLYRHAKAIGMLYDFYVLELGGGALPEQEMPALIRRFWEARRYGCENLGWKPVAYKTARDDLNSVTLFSDFCSENFGHAHLNPQERVLVSSLSDREFRIWLAKAAHRKKTDLLFHLTPSTQEGRGKVLKRAFDPERASSSRARNLSSPKHFPPDKVLELIQTTGSLRNRLCWMLMFFGSLRISELAHLYVGDVMLDPSDSTARVMLSDPRDGAMQWAFRGKQRRGPRAAFLLENYGRVPRTELPTRHPEHAGWKGLISDDGSRCESVVHWIDPRIGALFWKLHAAYMRAVRLHVGDEHPYYFVSLKGDSYGEPMKLGTLRKQFYAATTRIGLSSSQGGINPHGARHFYGWYCANVLKLPKERTQKLMHHASILSTEVYYNLDQAILKQELESAQARLDGQMPGFLQDERLAQALDGNDE